MFLTFTMLTCLCRSMCFTNNRELCDLHIIVEEDLNILSLTNLNSAHS